MTEKTGSAMSRRASDTHIVILTGNHLCNNPRVIKEAKTLIAAGFRVTILGAWFDPVLKARDRALIKAANYKFRPVFDGALGEASALVPRVRTKLGSLAHRILKLENAWQLGYAYPCLRNEALREHADLYIAHSEQALAVGAELMRRGRRVGVDMEDWFSQDLPEEARRGRPIALLKRLERALLQKGAPRFCTSRAMSAALAAAYDCPEPAVIYNAFPWCERETLDGKMKDRKDKARPSIHWYSQTLGKGRGLEILLQALEYVPHDAEIHLRGAPAAGFDGWLLANAPARWRERIFIHEVVSNEELLSRIAEHDIGFAGEIPYCRNKDLTISNKIFHYLLAGLAIVASDTKGQREIGGQAPGAIAFYPPENSSALGAWLCALLQSPELLAKAKSAALAAANNAFSWQNAMLEAVHAALK